ncbi:MAG: hypothetical protein J7623_05055 [Chitinophaga sp.]|uniref:hypothetical protein n=1 Tax=Chitinophaga sp. TaxID=1869181 RepID=UPI001B1FB4B2|nr:hypothetical protein [Chitinophaga sp.]MBO9727987.1 hypothetical protein [Chitinophaga sp.]
MINKKMFRKITHKWPMLLLLLAAGAVNAQNPPPQYTWQAALPPVPATGFYHITMTPAVAARVGGRPNFRIYQADKEVPYLLQEQVGGYTTAGFEPFEITDKVSVPGKHSTLVFHNANHYTLDHFEMVLKNARVIKTMRISGSDDKTNWYGVTDTFVFDPASAAPDASGTEVVKTIDIPSSKYTWYQLEINDSTSAPVFIEKIGRYKSDSRATEYTPVPAPVLSTPDAAKYPRDTRLHLRFDQAYLVNKLSFTITAPSLYRRSAEIIALAASESSVGKGPVVHAIPVAEFNLSSDQSAQVVLSSPGNYKELIVVVHNDDNPPLQISAVNAWQQTIWLTANLQQGASYVIKGGDAMQPLPVYDLAYFKDSVPAGIPVIQPQAPVNIVAAVADNKNSPVTVFGSKWWIWAALIVIAAFLVFLATKMLKEMQGKQ